MKTQEWFLHELMDRWFEDRVNNDDRLIRKSTQDSYCIEIRRAKRWFENMPISEITTELIQKTFNTAADNGSARSTINHVRLILNSAFKYIGDRSDEPFKNPVRRTVLPIRASVKDVMALTKEQQSMVEKACVEDVYGYLHLFLLLTGIRRQELCNLQWDDYDSKVKVIKIRESKTHSGIRTLPLLPLCDTIIKTQQQVNKFIFNQKNGTPITPWVLRATYNRIREASGVQELTNHVCRHTFATRLLETGAREKAISTLLGHSSVAFTLDRYVNAQPEYLRSQIMLIDTNPFDTGKGY